MTTPTHAELVASGRGLVEHRVFQTAVAKTRMAMALSDPNLPDCPLVYINSAFTDMTGYDFEAAVGRNCRFLQGIDTDPKAVDRVRQAIAAREPITEELYNYRRDGSGFWNQLYVSPVFDDDGTLTYFFASQVDVSARKEAMRRQTLRIESMGALASGVAHEFNNLMTVVLGNIDRAAERIADDSQKRYLERADLGARRASKLAHTLLDLAARQVSRDRTMDLNQVLRDFEGRLVQSLPAGMQVRLDLAPMPISVQVDPDQLETILLNLALNAADAMLPGGTVRLSTRALSPAEALSNLNGHDAVELSVSDNGRGMTPEVLERATELFFSTKDDREGTGLGLFLVLEFMDKAAGRLAIDSAPGQGTRVKLILPRAA